MSLMRTFRAFGGRPMQLQHCDGETRGHSKPRSAPQRRSRKRSFTAEPDPGAETHNSLRLAADADVSVRGICLPQWQSRLPWRGADLQKRSLQAATDQNSYTRHFVSCYVCVKRPYAPSRSDSGLGATSARMRVFASGAIIHADAMLPTARSSTANSVIAICRAREPISSGYMTSAAGDIGLWNISRISWHMRI